MSDEKEKIELGVHNYSQEDEYVEPHSPAIKERLEWFKDQKLGLMMHWGPYSQLGLVESWALSDYDADWSRNGIDWTQDMKLFKKQYFDLNKTFNPVRYQPEEWAKLAKQCGFKYFVFTTKHHDGFCMWDTKTTDYKITGSECPFRNNQNADIVRNAFDAFRAEGLGIAAYFSKADWSTEYYWQADKKYELECDRGPTYDNQKNKELWEKFVSFTHEQLDELLNEYGKIDVLWLDAGWVCKANDQDIRLGEAVERARSGKQPWLISSDRTVGGEYENYVTPEQIIPSKPMNIPWESNLTIGNSFSFAYEDTYKTKRQLVRALVDVVSKGGNLILNVGPQPDGRLPKGAIKSMHGLGEWLDINGEAIYATRVCKPYSVENWSFTQNQKNIYAIYNYSENQPMLTGKITIPLQFEAKSVCVLGGGKIEYSNCKNSIELQISSLSNKFDPITEVFVIEK